MGWKGSVYFTHDEDGLYFMGTKEKHMASVWKALFILVEGEKKTTHPKIHSHKEPEQESSWNSTI